MYYVAVVVSLGLSGKWPSKAEAVRRIRAAFNVKIAKSLQDSYKLTTKAHPDFVDVIQASHHYCGVRIKACKIKPQAVLLKGRTFNRQRICVSELSLNSELTF